MTPADFNRLGISWILKGFDEQIQNGRRAWGTNDIGLTILKVDREAHTARIMSRRREDMLTAFRAVAPQAKGVLGKLEVDPGPMSVPGVVIIDGKMIPFRWPVQTTEGILN